MSQWDAGLRKLLMISVVTLAPSLLGAACEPLLPRPLLDPGLMDETAFKARQLAWLRHATQDVSPGSILNVISHLERRRIEPPYAPALVVPADIYDAAFAKLARLDDTSDFDLLYLMNLWLGYRTDPALDPGLVTKIEAAILSFKYWYTEPTAPGLRDNMFYWSENHQIIFHTLEYLAGQSFPDRSFGNDGKMGREHQAHARALILEWLDLRGRFGFNEWHSDVYYQKNVTPLLTLVEYAEDVEIRTRAAMVLDLVLLDVASHQFRGNFGATHGRSYKKDKMKSVDQDTYGLSKLLFDDSPEDWNGTGEPGATLLARAARYRPPEVVRRIAVSRATTIDRQRMNLPIDELEPFNMNPQGPLGISYTDPDSLSLWWGMGAWTSWQVIPLTIDTMFRYDLWESTNFEDFKPFRDFVGTNILFGQAVALNYARMASLGLLKEVHTYTMRTADYMLSTAQDYRAGSRGSQYHAWQATLGPRAIVFTSHPGRAPVTTAAWGEDNEPGPGYWTGEASMPRSAQHENVGIHLYAPQYLEDAGFLRPLSRMQLYTHAFFPQDRFDEVVQDGSWVFGREGDGYVALYSWRPAAFVDYAGKGWATDGMTKPFDLVAAGGPDNVFIVECGRQADWGSFAAFRAAVAASQVQVTPLGNHAPGVVSEGFSVRYASPSQGLLGFGWKEPLTVRGTEVPLHGSLRFDSDWAQQPFDSRRTLVMDTPSLSNAHGLWLDFDKGTRRPFAPAAP